MTAPAFQNFVFDDQLLRVIDQGGAPWFVASDVCACIDLTGAKDAVRKLAEDEKMTLPLQTAGGVQRIIIISEGGLYTLVFRSQDAMAEGTAAWRFRRWVTGEVLPSIRRTGGYQLPGTVEEQADEQDAAEMDERRINLGLAIVREARMVFGRQAARGLWHRAGLPAVDHPTQQAMIEGGEALAEDFAGWAQERTVQERAARTSSDAFYRDYRAWCETNGLAPMNVAQFGRNFRRYGFPSFHSNGMWRIGIKLVSAVA